MRTMLGHVIKEKQDNYNEIVVHLNDINWAQTWVLKWHISRYIFGVGDSPQQGQAHKSQDTPFLLLLRNDDPPGSFELYVYVL